MECEVVGSKTPSNPNPNPSRNPNPNPNPTPSPIPTPVTTHIPILNPNSSGEVSGRHQGLNPLPRQAVPPPLRVSQAMRPAAGETVSTSTSGEALTVRARAKP